MTNTQCLACHRPAHDAYICQHCATKLRDTLARIPWLTTQLDITLARRDVIAAHAGAQASDGRPMPFNYRATQAETTLRHTLAAWANTVAPDTAAGTDAAADHHAAVLLAHLDRIRQRADAPQLVDEIGYAVAAATITVDQPAPLFFAGPCDQCGADLYSPADHHGQPTRAEITCRACGARYETTRRREYLISQVEHRLSTAAEIAAALPAIYGRTINAGTIRQWIHRGRLTPRAWMHNGQIHATRQTTGDRPMVRIGDVLDLAARQDV